MCLWVLVSPTCTSPSPSFLLSFLPARRGRWRRERPNTPNIFLNDVVFPALPAVSLITDNPRHFPIPPPPSNHRPGQRASHPTPPPIPPPHHHHSTQAQSILSTRRSTTSRRRTSTRSPWTRRSMIALKRGGTHPDEDGSRRISLRGICRLVGRLFRIITSCVSLLLLLRSYV